MGPAATLGAAYPALAIDMIRVDIRAKRYGTTQVLGPIAFTVEPGETVALLGPSGIGKSTLLRIVANLDPDFEGSVRRPEAIGMVFQEPTLLPWRTATDNLTLVDPALSAAAAGALLSRVGLAGREAAFPGQLSLGQQRRLALARAFAGQPEALILDEPFVSLDGETAEAMLDLTAELIAATRPATLFVTHARSDAERLATRIFELRGNPATLAT